MAVLSDLVAPHDVEQFLGVVWGRTMAHLPGTPGRFGHLLPWDRLNEILGSHRLEPPRLRLARAGQLVSAEQYGSPGGPGPSHFHLRYQDLARTLADGATLVLDTVDELQAPIQHLAADLERTLREHVQVNCYASFASQPGFDTHWDDHEVLVLQVHGRKRWRVFGPTRPHPTSRDAETPPRPQGEPHADFILTDGDVLHVPRGWWHDAAAVDSPSLHLTFGVAPATGADLLAWTIDRLHRHELVRQNIPTHADSDTQYRHVTALFDLLAQELDRPTVLSEFRAHRDARAPVRGYPSFPWSVTHDELPADTKLRLLASRARLDDHGETARLAADGQVHNFASPAQPVLRSLLDGASHSLSELAAAPGNTLNLETIRALAETLVRLGLVAITPPTQVTT